MKYAAKIRERGESYVAQGRLKVVEHMTGTVRRSRRVNRNVARLDVGNFLNLVGLDTEV